MYRNGFMNDEANYVYRLYLLYIYICAQKIVIVIDIKVCSIMLFMYEIVVYLGGRLYGLLTYLLIRRMNSLSI